MRCSSKRQEQYIRIYLLGITYFKRLKHCILLITFNFFTRKIKDRHIIDNDLNIQWTKPHEIFIKDVGNYTGHKKFHLFGWFSCPRYITLTYTNTCIRLATIRITLKLKCLPPACQNNYISTNLPRDVHLNGDSYLEIRFHSCSVSNIRFCILTVG